VAHPNVTHLDMRVEVLRQPLRREQSASVRKSNNLLRLTRVLIKLKFERLLRIRNLFYGGHGDFELTIAKSADRDSGCGSEPFEHSQSSLFHAWSFSQQSRGWWSSKRAENGEHWQKAFAD
jgi:hypothetical protein